MPKNIDTIKLLVDRLLSLHEEYLPNESEALLRRIDSKDDHDATLQSGPTYSLFSQYAHKDGNTGEETFYTGLRADTQLAIDNFSQIDSVIEKMIRNLSSEAPYSYYTLGIGNPQKQTVNHYVSLFAYQQGDEYILRYFNPLPSQSYNTYSDQLKEAIQKFNNQSPIKISLIEHTHKKIQPPGSYFCAELSSLYLYLSSLEYEVKFNHFESSDPKSTRDLFFENLLPETFPDIITKLKTQTAYELLEDLLASHKNLPSTVREKNIDFWAERITLKQFKDVTTLILDDLQEYLDNPTKSQTEKILLFISLITILTGFYIHMNMLSAAGALLMAYSGYKLTQNPINLKAIKKDFMHIIDNAFDSPQHGVKVSL